MGVYAGRLWHCVVHSLRSAVIEGSCQAFNDWDNSACNLAWVPGRTTWIIRFGDGRDGSAEVAEVAEVFGTSATPVPVLCLVIWRGLGFRGFGVGVQRVYESPRIHLFVCHRGM